MIQRLLLFSIFCLGLLFSTNQSFAQDNTDYDRLKYRKWRVTLFPPLSTNWTNAPDYTARYSIKILGGYHGGLDGGEIGGLINYNKYYAHGFQLAGLVNATGGDMAGINIAGGINLSKDEMSGMQFSGLANISGNDLEGIQGSGLFNIAGDNSSGLQFAGIGNIARGDIEGLQGSGIINAAWGDISGLQAAGVANIAREDVEGLQAAGVLNFAGSDISGLQAAGAANIAFGDIEGLMAAGGVNIARQNASGLFAAGLLNIANDVEGLVFSGGANIAKNLEGVQFASLLNFSEKATGVQIGLINIAKEFEGVPIGFVSLYGNGRKNMDVRFSDGGFTDIGLTLGTYRVYNSAIFGYNTLLDRDVYRIGLAVGLEKNINDSFQNWKNESMYVNQEFSVTHQFEEEWTRKLNLIYSYKFLLGKRFGSGFSLYGGPTFNAQISRVSGSEDYAWYSLWSPEWKGRDYRFWVGFTAGIRLFKQKAIPKFKDEFDNWDIDW
ncbi:MAG: hypothetical protein RIB15_12140 [Gracilimonas sp.]|uniref:hypothetical protein n=1 Tax=Gracilimonas sp. TaxID=1974203 RepID=UPI0032EB1D07